MEVAINEPQNQRELRPEAVGVAKGFFDGSSQSGRSSAFYDNKSIGSNYALQGFMFDYKDGWNHGLEQMIVAPNMQGVSVTLSDGDALNDKFSWEVAVAELPSDSKHKWINGEGSVSLLMMEAQDCDESPVLVSFHMYFDDDQAHNYNEFGIDLTRAKSFVGDECSTMIKVSLTDSSYDAPFKFEIQYALVSDLYVDGTPGQQIESKRTVDSAVSSDPYTCSFRTCPGEPILSGFHFKLNGSEFPIDMLQVGVKNVGVVNGKGETATKGFASFKDINGGESFDWFVRYSVVMDRVPSNLPYTLPMTTTTTTATSTTSASSAFSTTSPPPKITPSGNGDLAQTTIPPPTTPSGADTDPTTTTRFASHHPNTTPAQTSTASFPTSPTADAANNDPTTTTTATTTSSDVPPTSKGPSEWPCGKPKYFLVVEYGDNSQEIRVKVNPQVIDLGFDWTIPGTREEQIQLESGEDYVLIAKGHGNSGTSNHGLARVVQRVGIQNGIQEGNIEEVLAEIDLKTIGKQAKKHFAVPSCRI